MSYNVQTIIEKDAMKYEMVRDHSISIHADNPWDCEVITRHYNGETISEISRAMDLSPTIVHDTVVGTWAELKRDAAFWKAVDAV